MSKRRLTHDDKAVWDHVKKSVQPLKKEYQFTAAPKFSEDSTTGAGLTAGPIPALAAKPPKKAKHAPYFFEAPNKTSPNMDRRSLQKLIKGQMQIDLTLDLHGLTADEAKRQLQLSLTRAHKSGLRMVLVITGKGKTKRIDEFNRQISGVLRQNLPDWIKGPNLSHIVLHVSQAQPKHGGAGAFYVYLRRTRKNGA